MSFRKSALLVFSVLLLTFSFVVPSLTAQEGQPQGLGNGLQVSPTRTELSGNPGEQKTFSINMKNITQGELTLKAVLNDFESDNASGTPKIILDEKNRTPYTLAKMLTGLVDINLKGGETKEIKLTLDVPTNAVPGAYFGAIRYQVAPKFVEGEQRQVALNASVAHLVFLEIPGDINEQIQIESLKASQNKKPGSFFFKAPNSADLKIKNLGNGFSRPFGRVSLTGMTGKEVHAYDLNNVDPKGIILPNSSRTFTDEIKNVKIPGKYTITASAAYGNGGEVVNYKSSFWYLPVWFLALVLLIIAGTVGGGYYIYKKRFVKTTKTRR